MAMIPRLDGCRPNDLIFLEPPYIQGAIDEESARCDVLDIWVKWRESARLSGFPLIGRERIEQLVPSFSFWMEVLTTTLASSPNGKIEEWCRGAFDIEANYRKNFDVTGGQLTRFTGCHFSPQV